MQEIGSRMLTGLRDAVRDATAIKRSDDAPLGPPADEPPVVAQLMIEIRSDGTRTIARGALHDLRTNESANVRAEGRKPSDLMVSLVGSLLSLPSSALNMLRARELQPATKRAEQPTSAEPADKNPSGSGI
jgi:hypothetical protein